MADLARLLRRLPRVDEVLAHPQLRPLLEQAPRGLARQSVRESLAEVRARLREGDQTPALSVAAIAARSGEILRHRLARRLRRSINATGVVLHTGLGRAPLSQSAQAAIAEVAAGYCNVQIDADSGGRMHREAHVQWLLEEMTGAPAALVVNNNAAATVLALNTLAAGRQVIVSRGELVEIGGAFRLPDIIRLAQCHLLEVGCTNRTHLRDYEGAIAPEAALLLSVHQSNYRIEGFASQVGVADLCRLAHERDLLCVHDLGSGALVDLQQYGLPHEPTVRESLEAEADVVLFSGDKLLGGPQCGIIVGRSELLSAMRRNPHYRTFRVGKLTLAALESTLRLFLDAEKLPERHRLTSLLACPLEALVARAEALVRGMRERCGEWLEAEAKEAQSEIGGGSLAGHTLPTAAVCLRSDRLSADGLAHRLRLSDPPIFARVHRDSVLLDPRTMLPHEDAVVLGALEMIGRSLASEE
jgi:L-seryl-tRNA(Ser) seleniumtransferase